MLDENDFKDIAQIVKDAIKRDVTPQLEILIKKQKEIPDKLNSATRVKELEHEIKLLKKIIHKQSKDLQQLKKS